ncbi:ATP-binding protein [Pedobacter sp. BS3]|uniref:ATP-binding protein n=1 Tax=Pedobacter sp. BS3 TaxID=2567937 RepID=UPI0011EBE9CE|nr:ATP-binding protein [Pedobacter sp. BS3]TZF81788.1 ATP-binding protein [Pedobacter sp. BS3]
MNTETKQQIKADLANYVSKIGSANKARVRLGVSGATISNILNGKWENMADSLWLGIHKQVLQSDWIHSDTSVSKKLMRLYADAKENAEVRGATANAGRGKTHTAKLFVSENDNSFLVSCDQTMKIGDFLAEMLRAIGKQKAGLSNYEALNFLCEELLGLKNPFFIIDEFDKLKDIVKFLFISIYNRTEGCVSFFIQGAPYLKKSLDTLAKKDKQGAKEIIDRLNGKIIDLGDNTAADLAGIALINGINDPERCTYLVNDSDYSLRRLKSSVKVELRRRKEAV